MDTTADQVKTLLENTLGFEASPWSLSAEEIKGIGVDIYEDGEHMFTLSLTRLLDIAVTVTFKAVMNELKEEDIRDEIENAIEMCDDGEDFTDIENVDVGISY